MFAAPILERLGPSKGHLIQYAPIVGMCIWVLSVGDAAAGNLCRHSAYFYQHLDAHDIIPPIIERCSDPDSQTRKFACFAYGNAAFHNDSLYRKLAPGITSLVASLYDQEIKTRVNAAGALGNLARNGNTLVGDMINANAVKVSSTRSCLPHESGSRVHCGYYLLVCGCKRPGQSLPSLNVAAFAGDDRSRMFECRAVIADSSPLFFGKHGRFPRDGRGDESRGM